MVRWSSFFRWVATGTLVFALGVPTVAAQAYVGGVTPADVVSVLQATGYRAELAKDGEGDPMIRSATDGHNYNIYFYDLLKDGRARSIQFSYGLDLDEGLDPAVVDDWNRNYRFARAFLDDESDPFLRLDLDVEAGFNREALANNLERWYATLADFLSLLNE